MNIPYDYEAFRQAERREADWDRQDAQREKCGCCGGSVEAGEPFWRAARHGERFCICQSCKEDIDDSVTIAEEDGVC